MGINLEPAGAVWVRFGGGYGFRLLLPIATVASLAARRVRYAFYLPIVAMTWRHAAGYRPLVLLVGTQWRRPAAGSRLAVVLDALAAADARVQVPVFPSALERFGDQMRPHGQWQGPLGPNAILLAVVPVCGGNSTLPRLIPCTLPISRLWAATAKR